jgi:hypothetical protein
MEQVLKMQGVASFTSSNSSVCCKKRSSVLKNPKNGARKEAGKDSKSGGRSP